MKLCHSLLADGTPGRRGFRAPEANGSKITSAAALTGVGLGLPFTILLFPFPAASGATGFETRVVPVKIFISNKAKSNKRFNNTDIKYFICSGIYTAID